ncbi:MAG: CBS domain-containing protein [Thermodesulfobacteriota bacterium]
MIAYTAKDLMIPFSECVTVSEDASLYEAMRTLDAFRAGGDHYDYRLRVILVYDQTFSIVGWLRQPQVLRALEPKYREIAIGLPEVDPCTRLAALQEIMEKHDLWNESIETIALRAREILVKDVMSRPNEDEIISEDTPVMEAAHRMLMGNHLSLLVRGRTGFPGILRLSDLYSALNNEIHSCFTGKRAHAGQRR